VEEVVAADDQVHPLPAIVDDHAEPVRPVAVSVSDREIAGRRDGIRARSGQGVDPRLGPAAECDTDDRTVQPPPLTAARTSRSGPRPAVRAPPGRERRAAAVAAIDEAIRAQARERRVVRRMRVRVGLADRPTVRAEPQPRQVIGDRRVVFGPRPLAIVVLDAQQDVPGGGRGSSPRPDGVRDVSEVQVPGRRRGEPGGRARRERAGIRNGRRAASAPDPAPRVPASR
jgi:hypothetical protein